MSTAKLLEPAVNGAETFGLAIVSLAPALRRFAFRLTNNHAAADDLVQDTLTQAWAAQARFRAGTNIKAWLFRIAHNAFISGLRRSRRQVAWDPDRHDRMLVQAAMQDDPLYARDLRLALSHLSPSQHSAMVLITRDGMSMADAATRLGVPIGTIKSRLARARAALLAYISGEARDDGQKASASRPETQTRPRIGTRIDETRTADRAGPAHYQRWKASGATMIG